MFDNRLFTLNIIIVSCIDCEPLYYNQLIIFIAANVTALACTDLMDLVNGGITYDMETINNRPVDTVATYTCNVSYTLIGGSTRTCGSDRVWSGSDPVCEGWWPSCSTIGTRY